MDSTRQVLEKIKDTEAKAASIVKEAHEKAYKTILDAKIDSKETLQWAETKANAEANRILQETKSQTEKELGVVTKNMHKEKEELEKVAASSIPKAADFIIKELLKTYGYSKTK